MTGPAREHGLRWWRWFGAFWLALGVAGVATRNGYVVSLAGLFLTGCLAQEVRAVQRAQAPASPKAVVLSVLAAGLGAGSTVLAVRTTFHVAAPWWLAVVVFVALLVLYAAGPSLSRRGAR